MKLATTIFAAAAVLCATVACSAQSASDYDVVRNLTWRLDAQAAQIRELQMRLASQGADCARPVPAFSQKAYRGKPEVRRLPVVAETCWEAAGKSGRDESEMSTLHYYVDYDSGLVLRPFCPERFPFEMKFNGWMQFRHHGFARDVDSWTDSAGITRPIRNRNAFDIERARLIVSGYALDKRLTYFVQMDGNTDSSHMVQFFDYYWAWKFSDRFQIQLGKRKVPAVRQWLMGARRTRLVDRPMAADFFRPDRTVGIFGVGKLGKHGHYQAMVGNGYRTANIPNSGTDDHLTFAITNYFDPLGDFGGQIVDYGYKDNPLVRFGHSFVFSPQTDDKRGIPLPETRFLRLTDGTPLTQTGALAPGVTVSQFDIYLYSVDMAAKWRGWSIDAEAYFRWIQQIQGDGALPITQLYQHGFFVEGGRFIIRKRLDFNVRYSQISGLSGDASEYAAGFNWYPMETYKMKLSFDVTRLNRSPLNNTSSDILVGESGTLFRTQVQAEF